MLPDVHFEPFGVHIVQPRNISEKSLEVYSRIRSEFDLVITAPLSDLYGPLSLSNLQNELSENRLITIPNIYFSGLHPDLTYLGGLGRCVQSPIGDYHSKLAIIGFLTGRSVSETCELYNLNDFLKLNYNEAVKDSFRELQHREKSLDVTVSDIIEDNFRHVPCFMTVNHPTSFLLSLFVERLSNFIKSRGIIDRIIPKLNYHFLPNPLAEAAVFPIYPDIASLNQLSFSGNYFFKSPRSEGFERVYSLCEFIRGEYSAFQDVGVEPLRSQAAIKNLLEEWST